MVYKFVTVFFSNISSTEIYLSLLLITCAEIVESHFEIILFTKGYFKVIKLQVTLVYYLYYERDFVTAKLFGL